MPQGFDLLDDLTWAQQEAVTHFEGPLLILAGAGSGKTRVITRRVAYLLQQGVRPANVLAITFTNKAAGEMKARVDALVPGNRVWISTFHSLGARLLRQYGERIGLNRNFTIYDQDDRNKVIKQALDAAGLDNVKFTPERIGGAISKAKNQLLTPEKYAATGSDFFTNTAAKVYAIYQKKLRDANGLDFDDLLYIPALALKMDEDLRAELDARFKFVMIDEYQDTNSAQYEIAKRLSVDNRHLCVVGDPDQCLPPGTLVATPSGPRSIEKLKDGDEIVSGCGWGKSAALRIDKVIKGPFRGKLVNITVEGGRVLRATPNHICFGRLRATPHTHFVYLMRKRGMGYRLGTTRGVRTSKDGLILSGLQVRTNQEVADAVWVVRSCTSSSEARYYEQLLSVRYGLPTMVFFVRGRNMSIDQELIDRLYREIDTEAAAARLMVDFHLDRRFPHHRPGAVIRGELARRHVLFTVFGDNRPKSTRPWHEHRVQLVTTGNDLRERARAAFNVRSGQRGTWRIETSRTHYDEGRALAESIAKLDQMEVISRARLTESKAYMFMPASHVHAGMSIPVLEDGRVVDRQVLSVEWEEYEGPVYDLSVPNTRNFVANGVVVHNSIYKWRGSDIKNILDFERDFRDARVITLDKNYRSTPAILRAADAVIANNRQRKKKILRTDNAEGEPVRVLTFDTGLDEANLVAQRIKDAVEAGKYKYGDFAVFVRMNALTRILETAFAQRGVPFQIVKGLAFFDRKENKDVLAYLRLIVNPADNISFLRAVNEPARGIGKVSLDHLQAFAELNQVSLLESAGQVAKIPAIKGKARDGLRQFHQLMGELRGMVESPPEDVIRTVLDKSGYRDMLKAGADDDDIDRLANVEELITSAKQFTAEDGSRTIRDFLEQITLASDVDSWDDKQDRVSVMTLHAAKGLEFPVVFVIAMEQGILPGERSLQKEEDVEEERRVAFVGMTRAMRELYLCHARLRDFRGQTLYAIPSMFLEELPDEVIEVDAGAHGGRSPAKDLWRGGPPAARSAWADVSPRTPLPPAMPHAVTSNPDAADYERGQIVQHEQYGIGTITDVSGYGALRKVKIRFAVSGEKTFIADKVKLKAVTKK
jgi:DNA helicase II / ATP-dependent DNA helicase PcrA